jgi:tetratricopeptide (TPR) repeat protein
MGDVGWGKHMEPEQLRSILRGRPDLWRYVGGLRYGLAARQIQTYYRGVCATRLLDFLRERQLADDYMEVLDYHRASQLYSMAIRHLEKNRDALSTEVLSIHPGSQGLIQRKVFCLAALRRWRELVGLLERLACLYASDVYKGDLAEFALSPGISPAPMLDPDFFGGMLNETALTAGQKLPDEAVPEAVCRLPFPLIRFYIRGLRLEGRYSAALEALKALSLLVLLGTANHDSVTLATKYFPWLGKEREVLRRTVDTRQEGEKLFGKDKFLPAADAFAETLKIDLEEVDYPGMPPMSGLDAGGRQRAELHCWRGYCFQDFGWYEEALEEYKEALQTNPQYMSALQCLSLCYVELEQYEEAIEGFKQWICLAGKAKNNVASNLYDHQFYLPREEIADDLEMVHDELKDAIQKLGAREEQRRQQEQAGGQKRGFYSRRRNKPLTESEVRSIKPSMGDAVWGEHMEHLKSFLLGLSDSAFSEVEEVFRDFSAPRSQTFWRGLCAARLQRIDDIVEERAALLEAGYDLADAIGLKNSLGLARGNPSTASDAGVTGSTSKSDVASQPCPTPDHVTRRLRRRLSQTGVHHVDSNAQSDLQDIEERDPLRSGTSLPQEPVMTGVGSPSAASDTSFSPLVSSNVEGASDEDLESQVAGHPSSTSPDTRGAGIAARLMLTPIEELYNEDDDLSPTVARVGQSQETTIDHVTRRRPRRSRRNSSVPLHPLPAVVETVMEQAVAPVTAAQPTRAPPPLTAVSDPPQPPLAEPEATGAATAPWSLLVETVTEEDEEE